MKYLKNAGRVLSEGQTNLLTILTAATLALGMASCSSSRNAQNTDDIYYSDGSRRVAGGGSGQGDYYSTAPSDNYVRMKAQDYDRWSYFDDYNAADAYYSPAAAYGIYPSVGFGYGLGYGYGLGLGYGMGFYDPFWAWNSYFMWNSWYNPYFYNPYYGGAVFYGEGAYGHGAAYAATNLRPLNVMSYRNGLTRKTGTSAGRFYRQGMAGTAAYNNRLSTTGRRVNNTYYRPNNNSYYRTNNGFSRPAFNNGGNNNSFRSYTPSTHFSGGGGGGGFRGGGGGFRGH
jgi:hypothetical protein